MNLIFARRSIQQMLDRLTGILTPEQRQSLLDRLNRKGDARLPAVWETVILGGLHAIGSLRHEVELTNNRKPDFALTAFVNEHKIEIIGDITTISNSGLEEKNPIGVFQQELNRLIRKHDLNPNKFHWDISGYHKAYGDEKPSFRLRLPQKSIILRDMRNDVEPWLLRIKEEIENSNVLNIEQEDFFCVLSYDPTQVYQGGGHPGYDSVTSLSRNVLFSTLKRKAAQLKHASADAVRIVVVCDGGSSLLRRQTMPMSRGVFSARDIAKDFLRQNSSVDVVLLVTVEGGSWVPIFTTSLPCKLHLDWVLADQAFQSARLSPPMVEALEKLAKDLSQSLPPPMQLVHNARARSEWNDFESHWEGAYKMTDNSVTLSSRMLMKFLSGEISAEKFNEDHTWNNAQQGNESPFLLAIQAGKMISKVSVESGGPNDDDWITFEFSSSDAAITSFK